MKDIRPLILVSNDDSINAPGILRLVDCLPQDADIYVVAPEYPQSGMSSALSVTTPLRISGRPDYGNARMFTVNGTPVDCIKMAMHAIVPRKPDLVLAGINHGSNSCINVIYSGTMGAVMEGCMLGICSCGFSLLSHSMEADFSMCMPYVKGMVEALLRDGLPDGICLNVNIPAKVEPRGVKVCRAARGYWSDGYQEYTDPGGRAFYLLAGRFVNTEPEATDTDEYWLSHDYITAVPVYVDMTEHSVMPFLAKRFDK